MSFDSATQEWVYLMGGPHDDGWQILPKGMYDWRLPMPIPMPSIISLSETPMAVTMPMAIYRYQGRRRVAENLMGYMVTFRVFEWMGEQ